MATPEPTPDLLEENSQEATALGTVCKPWTEKSWVIIKETQEPEEEYLGAHSVRGALPASTSPSCSMPASEVASPAVSEFERYLQTREAQRLKPKNPLTELYLQEQRKKSVKPRQSNSSDDEDDPVPLATLHKRQRLADDLHSRTISIENIIPEIEFIGAVEETIQSLPPTKPTRIGKKKVRALWTYETVAEPTGVASKYWDANAPRERTTKKLAKEKLAALSISDLAVPGYACDLFFVVVCSPLFDQRVAANRNRI